MSLAEKGDAKDQLCSRHYNGIHLAAPASQPDATGFSGEQSSRPDSNDGNIAEELLPQPGIAVPGARPLETEPELRPFAVPAISKSARV